MTSFELADRVAAIAAALAQLGVRHGDRVLIMRPDGPGFVEAFLGAMEWGAVPLPVNPVMPTRDVVAIATDADARLVVAAAEGIQTLADLAVEPPVLVDGPEGAWAAVLRLE